MTSNAHPSSARSRRRGTRGFAAFVTAIAGFVSLAVGAVVLPATSLDTVASELARPARARLRHRPLRRRRRPRPEPPLGRPPGRLSLRDRHRRRGLRAPRDPHRPRPVRRDELAAGARGSSRRPRPDGLDDRPLAGRRPVRPPWRRAGRPDRRSPGRDARGRLTPGGAAAADSNPRRRRAPPIRCAPTSYVMPVMGRSLGDHVPGGPPSSGHGSPRSARHHPQRPRPARPRGVPDGRGGPVSPTDPPTSLDSPRDRHADDEPLRASRRDAVLRGPRRAVLRRRRDRSRSSAPSIRNPTWPARATA